MLIKDYLKIHPSRLSNLFGNNLLRGISWLGAISLVDDLKAFEASAISIISTRLGTGLLISFMTAYLTLSSPVGFGFLMSLACLMEVHFMSKKYTGADKPIIVVTVSTCILLGLWSYFAIYSMSRSYVFYVVTLAVVSDACAYFLGSFVTKKLNEIKLNEIRSNEIRLNDNGQGKKIYATHVIRSTHVISPMHIILELGALKPVTVSPNKTIAGFIGALLSVIIVVLSWNIIRLISMKFNFVLRTPFGISSSLLLIIAGQCGDLLESWVKRKFQVKDSGKLFGSHGGVCDRMDSICSVLIMSNLLLLFKRSMG